MQESTNEKKYGLPVKIAVLCLIFTQMTQAFCNPSIAGIMAEFPGAPVTSVQTIINIPTLIMIFSALGAGAIAQKIGYKTTGIVAMLFSLIGGIAPAFIHPSVEVMIVERAVFGVGYGLVYALSIAAAGEFWRGKETTAMVGAVIFGAGLSGIVFNLLSAVLAPMGWEVVYYGYFLIIPLLIYYAIFMPQRPCIFEDAPSEKPKKVGFSLSGLGVKYWTFIICSVLALASVSAFMNNIAMIVVGTGIDTTGAAIALIMTAFTAGLMIGGGAYPLIYRFLKRATMPVYLLLDAVCFVLIMLYASYVTLLVLALVIGFVFGGLNAEWGDMANKKVSDYPAASANGASIYIAAGGIAQFVSPFFLAGLAGLFGQTELNPFYQYYPAITIIAVGGIALMVMAILRKNKVDYERDDAVPAEIDS